MEEREEGRGEGSREGERESRTVCKLSFLMLNSHFPSCFLLSLRSKGFFKNIANSPW